MISVQNLTRYYGSFPAVEDVSFQVGRGQIWGLLGPNGAGKTTLMKVLTGFHYPSLGKATIGEVDVVEQTASVQSMVGYLPEMAPLYKEMLVYEYLDFVGEARLIPKDIRKEKIERVAKECGIDDVLHKGIDTLSKGYRQRVGLAQAILHDPEVLILDEPTTGLDPNQILDFRQLIRKIGSSKTVILSTHILQEVEAICDHLMIMHQGKILASGPTNEITRSLKGDSQIRVQFLVQDAEQALKKASAIPGVIGAPTLVSSQPFELAFTLEEETLGAKSIFQWAVENSYPIISMIPQTYTLQEIFTKLTKEA